MGRRPVTVRLARWSAEHPWRAIALWAVFVAVCFVGGSAAGLNEATGNDQAIGETGRAGLIVDAGNFDDPAVDNVLITSRSGALDQTAAKAAADDAAARLRTVAGVSEVGQPVTARDGSALLLPITMSGDSETAADRVQPLRDVTAGVQAAHPQLRVEQVGGPSISQALDDTLGKDFKRAELLSLPVTLAILIIAFGALIAASVPVLLALSSVAAAMGLSTLASHLVPATDTTAPVILLIGMAVGVDYSLFYIRREREERAKGRSGLDAVEIAAETSGHAVVVSGFAVIISMAGLLLAGDVVFSSLAVGSILVVAVAVTGSLTVLPALLARLGRWVDRPRVPLLWRLTAPRVGRHGAPAHPSLARGAPTRAARPVATLVVSVGLLLALAAPALGMKLKFPGMEDLPRTTAAMQAYDRLTAAFPSAGTNHVVAVRAPAEQADRVRAALTDLSTRAAGDPLFAPVEADGPKIEVSADRRVSVLDVATRTPVGTTGRCSRWRSCARTSSRPNCGASRASSTRSAGASPTVRTTRNTSGTSCLWSWASCWC
ncbi:MMPL family transporter [Micromonospora sp. M12]